MRHSTSLCWLLVCCGIAACGGGEPAASEPAGTEAAGAGAGAEQPADDEAATPPGDQGQGGDDGGDEQASAEPGEPALPEPAPIEATDADGVREALDEASRDGDAFMRIVDPDMGIGAWDRGEDMQAHFCERSRFAQETSLGYELREGDEWSCNGELTRCSSVDPDDRIGTVFHFREADGGGRWLSSIIRYDRRVPHRDPESVAEWVQAAKGVCKLWRTLTGDPEDIAPDKLTVFVSGLTEDADESSTDFHCGDEANKVAHEQIDPLVEAGPPTLCRRQPLSCVWMGDPDMRVFGEREHGTPIAVAKTAVDLREGPERMQERQVEAVIKRAEARRCQ